MKKNAEHTQGMIQVQHGVIKMGIGEKAWHADKNGSKACEEGRSKKMIGTGEKSQGWKGE